MQKIDKRIGAKFWQARAKHGKDKIFKTPELLWDAACEYFKWCEDNPLYEVKPFNYQGDIIYSEVPKMRAMTLFGLCLFLDVSESYFRNFKIKPRKNKEEYVTVIEKIEKIIYTQKFQGAAADMLNANIIARDLGLKDNSAIDLNIDNISTLKLPDYMK